MKVFLTRKNNIKMIRSILIKYSAVLAFAVPAIVFLPEVAFAQGSVIGYVCGDNAVQQNWSGYPSNAQLDRLTHVMAVDLYPDANGYLHTVHMFNRNINAIWNGNDIDPWLTDLVNRAHQRGVRDNGR